MQRTIGKFKPTAQCLMVSGLLAAHAVLLANNQAHAQTGADAPMLEEVVVTASKREQALSDVPNSVSAFTGEFLDDIGAFSLQDYATSLPGVQYANQGTPGQSTLTMRGIATGSEPTPTVAVYLDEAALSSNSAYSGGGGLAADLATIDLDRVEVLRGPQGTLYGASALGGLFKYVTRKPTTDGIEGRVEAEYSDVSEGSDGYGVNGVINLPLGDSVALRASGYIKELPGWVDNVGTGEDDSNEGEQSGGRLALAWDATDALRLTLTGIQQTIDMDGRTQVDFNPNSGKPVYGDYVTSTRTAEPFEQDFQLLTGVIEWDLGFASLLSATSYQDLDSERITDEFAQYAPTLAVLPLPDDGTARFRVDIATEKFDQEIRLASNGDGRLNWLGGFYYTKQESDTIQQLDFWSDDLGGAVDFLPVLADINLDLEYEEYAVFGELYWSLTDALELSAGLRWSQNEQDYKQDALGLAINPVDPTTPIAAPGDSDEDVTTWMVSAKWDATDNAMFYARVATGYRAGGPNPVLATTGDLGNFDSDETTNFEIGYRGAWLENSLQTNATLFYIDWDDIQITQIIGGAGVRANGGGATSEGLELEVMWLPVAGLTLGLNTTYTDAQLTEDTPSLVIGGLDGDALPLTPEWATNAFAEYRFGLGDSMEGFATINYRYVDDRDTRFDSALTPFGDNYVLESYGLLDLRAGLVVNAVQFTLWGRNITDEEAEMNSAVYGSPFSTEADLARVVIGQPRTVGLTVSYDF
ncbi:TonB-dependent receptor [Pseudohalioglobus sediminis]|nr:TonB-dependent receptor [Pseudohalioglobus sediminis]